MHSVLVALAIDYPALGAGLLWLAERRHRREQRALRALILLIEGQNSLLLTQHEALSAQIREGFKRRRGGRPVKQAAVEISALHLPAIPEHIKAPVLTETPPRDPLAFADV